MALTLADLAAHAQADCVGDAALEIDGVNTLQDGSAGQIGFLSNPR